MKTRKLLQILAIVGVIAGLTGCAHGRRVLPLSQEEYRDKVEGAWLGKCIGGALGMPIEGWHYENIKKKYGQINDYIGYFDEIVMATTPPVAEVAAPAAGGAEAPWQTVTLEATVPDYDVTKFHACPAIGFAGEKSDTDSAIELRNLKIEGGQAMPALGPEAWQGYFVNVKLDGIAYFEYKNYFGSQYLKLTTAQTKLTCLKPGTKLTFTCDVRVISGVHKLVVAFDHVLTGPRPGFGPDDDTTYQIVGLLALEQFGPDLSAKQIGKQWTQSLGFVTPLLAEGLALERLRKGIDPPESGVHKMDEAIGGQIKAEVWGLVCPGRPDLAAEYARRDGVVAHRANGVYGEQFVAAMIAESFYEDEPAKLIEAGLNAIPEDSQYAKVVRQVVAHHGAGKPYEPLLAELVKQYPMPCDPLFGDAGIVALALLYGQGDFEKTILIAAMCGQDTDCDAATVGAVVGCIQGAKALPAKWRNPIADEFRCFAAGHETWSIKQLTERFCAAGEKIKQFHGRGMKFSEAL